MLWLFTSSVVVIEVQVIWNMYKFKIHVMYFVTLRKIIYIFNWNAFLFKILKVTENNISAGCIQFDVVLGITFQPVFPVFLFIYCILNCHSVNTKLRYICLFHWLICNDFGFLYFAFQLLSLELFCILDYLSEVIDKINWNTLNKM